jgi:hypothetical protein
VGALSVTFTYPVALSVTFTYPVALSVTFTYPVALSVTFTYPVALSVTFTYPVALSVTLTYPVALSVTFTYPAALSVTFTYPVAAEVTSGNKKLLLDICDSNVFQEVLIFGAYPAYLDFIKHNITKTHSVFKMYFLQKWKCTISNIKSILENSYCSSRQPKRSYYCKLFRSKPSFDCVELACNILCFYSSMTCQRGKWFEIIHTNLMSVVNSRASNVMNLL